MNRQRGVALIVALLVVALSSLLVAAMLDSSERTHARARNNLRYEQTRQLARGIEALAVEKLLEDQGMAAAVDGLDEPWAEQMPPIDILGAHIEGRLQDLGGCFNINSLVNGSTANQVALRRFSRLLRVLRLPTAIAAQAVDYLDADQNAIEGGAEDGAYIDARTADRALVDPSELKRLPAMTTDAWRALSPLICALPTDQPVNLNTALPIVWQMLDDAITPAVAGRLARTSNSSYPDLAAVRIALVREGVPAADLSGCDVISHYFIAQSDITSDGIVFSYTSILRRTPQTVYVIARKRGIAPFELRP